LLFFVDDINNVIVNIVFSKVAYTKRILLGKNTLNLKSLKSCHSSQFIAISQSSVIIDETVYTLHIESLIYIVSSLCLLYQEHLCRTYWRFVQ